MFVKRAWYVAATAAEVGRTPLARSVCGEPIVFFRSADGTARALADRCIHRRLPLSRGRLAGDRLICGYHGFAYDPEGRCVAVPGQDRVPRRAAVHAYPLVERYGWIWVWMGAPDGADPSLLPAMPGLDEDGWVPFRDRLHVRAHYQLLVDNLIDLSHETYVHTSSIGNDAVAETPIESRRQGNEVFVDRIMRDIPPPPFFAQAAGSDANIDRYQLVHFQPPCYVHVEVRAVPPGQRRSRCRGAVLRARLSDARDRVARPTISGRCRATSGRPTASSANGGMGWSAASSRRTARSSKRSRPRSKTDSSGARTVDVAIDGGTILARQVVDGLLVAENGA